MKVIKKFPVNPNIIIFFTTKQQTTKMSESYTKTAENHPFAQKILDIDMVRRVQITRYEIRIYKQRSAHWNQILPDIEKVIKDIFPRALFGTYTETHSQNIRSFPYKSNVSRRVVYEGVEIAQTNPLAKCLFKVQGIERVIIDPESIEVKCSAIFLPESIWPQVVEILE